MTDRDEMGRALAAKLVPVLRERGFKGSMPHFRRVLPDRTDLLTIQFDRHGGGFVIEIAVGPPDKFITSWGQTIPADKLSAHDLHPGERARVQPGADGSPESWFRHDGRLSPDRLAEQAASSLDQMEVWWSGDRSQKVIRAKR